MPMQWEGFDLLIIKSSARAFNLSKSKMSPGLNLSGEANKKFAKSAAYESEKLY